MPPDCRGREDARAVVRGGGIVRYGLPYKGSKNAIARWLVEQLPKADTFLDLFFGGERQRLPCRRIPVHE